MTTVGFRQTAARSFTRMRARKPRVFHVLVRGYDLQLSYDEKGWRATFYTTGMEHSPTSATGTGWERTPWHAVQGGLGSADQGRVECFSPGRGLTPGHNSQ